MTAVQMTDVQMTAVEMTVQCGVTKIWSGSRDEYCQGFEEIITSFRTHGLDQLWFRWGMKAT